MYFVVLYNMLFSFPLSQNCLYFTKCITLLTMLTTRNSISVFSLSFIHTVYKLISS